MREESLKVGVCPTCQSEICAMLVGEEWIGDTCPGCGWRCRFEIRRTRRGAVSQAAEHLRVQTKKWSS